MREPQIPGVVLDREGEAPDELAATAHEAVHRREHVGAAEVVEEALGVPRFDGVGAHAHDVDVRAEEAHDRGADRGRVARRDRLLEALVGFDLVQSRPHVGAAGLLGVDSFADVPERFHPRLRGRMGAGDGARGDEQDPRRIRRAGDRRQGGAARDAAPPMRTTSSSQRLSS